AGARASTYHPGYAKGACWDYVCRSVVAHRPCSTESFAGPLAVGAPGPSRVSAYELHQPLEPPAHGGAHHAGARPACRVPPGRASGAAAHADQATGLTRSLGSNPVVWADGAKLDCVKVSLVPRERKCRRAF